MRGKMLKILKNNINIEKLCNQLIWHFTVILFVVFGLLEGHELIQILMYGITGCVGCLIIIKERTTFRPKIQSYHLIIAAFLCICYASSLWGIKDGYAFSTSGYIARMFICMSVFYYHYGKLESTESLLQAIKWGGYLLAVCSLIGFGLKNVIEILLHGGRLFNEFVCFIDGEVVPGLFHGICSVNINYLGLHVAIPLVIGMYDVTHNRKKIIYECPFLILSTLFLIISGGKMNFLILFLGVFLVLLKKTIHKDMKKTILRWFMLLIIGIGLLFVLSKISMFEATFSRFFDMAKSLLGISYDTSTNDRTYSIKIGIEQFLNSPVLGIGVDNVRLILEKEMGLNTYIHCNYIELLVGIGIIGVTAFYACYIIPWIQMYKCRICKDSQMVVCTFLIILILVADVASVTYTWRATYLYFALFFIQARNMKIKAKNDNFL